MRSSSIGFVCSWHKTVILTNFNNETHLTKLSTNKI